MRIKLLILLVLLFCGVADAQDSQSAARRIKVVATLPATCLTTTAQKDVVIKTGATPGLYYCAADGASWTQDAGSTGITNGAGNNVITKSNGTNIVASGLTDDGTTVTSAENLALGSNSLTMTGSLGATGARLTKGWFTDLQVTNAIAGSITGNAATVTTNANLTGPITSSGNATSIASQTGTGTTFVVNTSPTLVTPNIGVATATSLASGAITDSSTFVQTSNSAAAFESGPNGSTNPVVRIKTNTASQADGIQIDGLAAGSGTTITALSSGSNSPITLTPKGNGAVVLPPGPDTATNGLGFTGFTNIGIGAGSNALRLFNNGERFAITSSGMITYSTALIGFSSSGTVEGTMDVAIYRNAAGKLEVNSGTAGTFRDLIVRQYFADSTAAGSTGAQTINKSVFSVQFAGAATSLVVTNSLVSTASFPICTVNTNDTTMKSVAAVPTSGTLTLTANAAATGTTVVSCVIH